MDWAQLLSISPFKYRTKPGCATRGPLLLLLLNKIASKELIVLRGPEQHSLYWGWNNMSLLPQMHRKIEIRALSHKHYYETFSVGISARKWQGTDRISSSHIEELLFLLWSGSSVSDPDLVHRWRSLELHCTVEYPPSCESSWRPKLQKPRNAQYFQFVIKIRSANHPWRPSSKAARKRIIMMLSNLHMLHH